MSADTNLYLMLKTVFSLIIIVSMKIYYVKTFPIHAIPGIFMATEGDMNI